MQMCKKQVAPSLFYTSQSTVNRTGDDSCKESDKYAWAIHRIQWRLLLPILKAFPH